MKIFSCHKTFLDSDNFFSARKLRFHSACPEEHINNKFFQKHSQAKLIPCYKRKLFGMLVRTDSLCPKKLLRNWTFFLQKTFVCINIFGFKRRNVWSLKKFFWTSDLFLGKLFRFHSTCSEERFQKKIALKRTLSVNLVSNIGRERFGTLVKSAFYLPSCIFAKKYVLAKIYIFENNLRLRAKFMAFGEKNLVGLQGANCTCLKVHAEQNIFFRSKRSYFCCTSKEKILDFRRNFSGRIVKTELKCPEELLRKQVFFGEKSFLQYFFGFCAQMS